MARRRKQPIPTPDEARRAIYIDFEGTKKDLPTLLGALWKPDSSENFVFEQYVFEPMFESAVEAKTQNHPANRPDVNPSIHLRMRGDAFKQLAERALDEERLVFAWSQYDAATIEELGKDDPTVVELAGTMFDAKKLAKQWKRHFRPEVVFERSRGRGRHTLKNYRDMDVIGYPPIAGVLDQGNISPRIKEIRRQLAAKRTFDKLTRVAKGKWTKILHHNYLDCDGMRVVVTQATYDLAQQRHGGP